MRFVEGNRRLSPSGPFEILGRAIVRESMLPVKERAASLKVSGREMGRKGRLASRICFAAPNQSTGTYVYAEHHELGNDHEAKLG